MGDIKIELGLKSHKAEWLLGQLLLWFALFEDGIKQHCRNIEMQKYQRGSQCKQECLENIEEIYQSTNVRKLINNIPKEYSYRDKITLNLLLDERVAIVHHFWRDKRNYCLIPSGFLPDSLLAKTDANMNIEKRVEELERLLQALKEHWMFAIAGRPFVDHKTMEDLGFVDYLE